MKRLTYIFAIFNAVLSLHAQAVNSSIYNFSIEPPVEWEASSNKNGKMFLFTSPDKKFNLIVSAKEKTYTNADTAVNNFLKDLNQNIRNVRKASFFYNNYPALLADYSVQGAGESVFAFLLCIIAEKYEYWLHLSFTGKTPDSTSLALIYSALDSFAIGDLGRKTPGPISQFDTPLTSNQKPVKVNLNFQGHNLILDMDQEQAEAAQRLVEREALIMSRYRERNSLSFLAWVRYYRFVYRDNYMRLEGLIKLLAEHLQSKNKETLAAELLPFCQSYSYARFTTPSDLIAPYASIFSQKGDCDSSSLIYLILLNHMHIQGALLLSQDLGHAVAGVYSSSIPGASIEIMEERYVIAELTTKQPLGTIPAKVAETKDWFPIIFTAS